MNSTQNIKQRKMTEIKLSDGLNIFCIHPSEAKVLDVHVNGYLEHGISISDHSVIFDVGANIGLFGIRTIEQYPNANIYAFEPIPNIFNVCQENAKRYGNNNIQVFDYGLSDKQGVLNFTYFPNCPALSTAHLSDWDKKGSFTNAVRGNLKSARKVTKLAYLAPNFLASIIAKFLTSKKIQVDAKLSTVSDVIYEHNIKEIDLIKIDCEGAELNVLKGINDEHWLRINQIVAEVHDLDNRLNEVITLLKSKGFEYISTADEEGFESTKLTNVYATKINTTGNKR